MYKELAEMDASYDHTMKNPKQYAKAVVVKIDNAKVEVKTFAAMLNIQTIRATLASSPSTYHQKYDELPEYKKYIRGYPSFKKEWTDCVAPGRTP